MESCDNPGTCGWNQEESHTFFVPLLPVPLQAYGIIGLSKFRTETIDVVLQEAGSMVEELLTLTDIANSEEKVNDLLLKMKKKTKRYD